MIYVVTDRGVLASDKLSEINKKLDARIDKEELVWLGADAIVSMTDTDIDFVRDKKRMSNILFGNFFKKDNSVKIIALAATILSFINMIMCSQFYSMLQKFLSSINVN